MPEVSIVAPNRAQVRAVAELRYRAGAEFGERAAIDGPAFVDVFVGWFNSSNDHHCLVAVIDESVVGFGFLHLASRAPSVGNLSRAAGDIQTVYVLPKYRDRGVGGAIVQGLIDLAESMQAEHVTVHGNSRAAPLYRRAGFDVDPMLLYREGSRGGSGPKPDQAGSRVPDAGEVVPDSGEVVR